MPFMLVLDHDAIARVAVNEYKREIKARGHDLRPAWDGVLDVIHRYEMMLFENEGSTPEHGAWRELSNDPHPARENLGYRDWKEQHYPGTKILELTGRLKAQLTGFDDSAFVRRGVRRLTFGSNYPVRGGHDLGGLHAEGALGPGLRYMPPRPPIVVTTSEVDDIADAALDYLLEGPTPNLPALRQRPWRRRVLSAAHRRALSVAGRRRWRSMNPQERRVQLARMQSGRRTRRSR